MKYIPVFHPSGVALRSKSVPDGFVTKDFAKKWNNSVYSRLSKMLCGFNLGSTVEHRFSPVPQAARRGLRLMAIVLGKNRNAAMALEVRR